MKLNYNTEDGRMHIELAGENVKDLFERLSEFQEVFEADTECGCCHVKSVRFLARKVDDYKFYELSCRACGARMGFGQAKQGGGLFPKRKDEDGEWLPNRGWAKFQPKTEAVGNGHTNGASKPAAAPAKTNGVPTFANWDDAQAAAGWGWLYVNVKGQMYKNIEGNYTVMNGAAK